MNSSALGKSSHCERNVRDLPQKQTFHQVAYQESRSPPVIAFLATSTSFLSPRAGTFSSLGFFLFCLLSCLFSFLGSAKPQRISMSSTVIALNCGVPEFEQNAPS